MPDTKISAAADIVSLNATDMLPVARSGSTTAYRATMAEIGTYVAVPAASSTTPAMDGTAAVGTGTTWARADHVHPTDTSRAPLASPTFTGTVTIPTGASIAGYAPLASPAFTGTPSLPTGTTGVTQAAGNNSTALATTAFVAPSLQAAQDSAGRNRLHNPGFTVNQRSYASGTALAAAAYGHDRWKAGASGCTYTFTQSYPTTTLTITAGSLQQIIEARDVAGGTYTLSWTGTAQGRVNAGTYAASPVTTAGLAANTAVTVEFNTGTVGSVQFEAGTQATPLDAGGSPQQILAQCQRFFVALSGLGVGGSAGAGGVLSLIGPHVSLPVAMRAAPTATITGTPSYVNASAVTVTVASTQNFGVGCTVTAAGGFLAQTGGVTFSADL